jgi:YHS domain-containing protein
MKKRTIFALSAALLLVLSWTVLAQTQAADTAKDPVCGMTVKISTAKYSYDYKGTTYYFCSEGCKTSFAKEPEKYLAPAAEKKSSMMGQGMGMKHAQDASQLPQDSALDPVCGMMVKKATAKYTYDYKGTTYYFCSEGCKTSFAKEPEKYLAPAAGAKPGMKGQGMGMMHGQMAGQGGMQGMAGNCACMLPDVEKKFENTKTGVVITLSSKNAESVKKLQEHAAMMKDGKCPMMDKGQAAKEGEGGCPMGASCPMKKK